MKKFLVICLVLILFSCKSYHIEPSDLKSQLEQTEAISDDRPEQVVKNSYFGKNLSKFKATNSRNKETVLDSENQIILKVSRKDGFKFKYYLNSISINGNTFTGMGPTYLVGGMIHKVHIDSIASIKVKP